MSLSEDTEQVCICFELKPKEFEIIKFYVTTIANNQGTVSIWLCSCEEGLQKLVLLDVHPLETVLGVDRAAELTDVGEQLHDNTEDDNNDGDELVTECK